MADFSLQILTPSGVIFDDKVQSVVAPGVVGRFGVLSSHAPMIAETDIGVVELTDAEKKTRYFSAGEGIFEVVDNKALLLADSAAEADSLEAAKAKAQAQA